MKTKVRVDLNKLLDGKLEKPTVLTAEEQKRRDSIMFPVSKVPLEERLGIKTASGISHGIIAHLPEGDTLINTCSKSYGYKHISEVINPIEEQLFKKFTVKPTYQTNNGTSFLIKYELVNGSVDLNTKDKMKPTIILKHSYDGKVKFQMTYGFYRLVCSNGMVVGQTKVSKKMKHGINKIESLSENAIEMFVQDVIEDVPEYVEKYRVLSDRSVSNIDERIEAVLSNTAFPQRFSTDIQEIATREQKALGYESMNDWLVYSAFNNVLNHNDKFKADFDKRIKIDNEIIDYMLETV